VTIGAYDGVHLGHRSLLSELSRAADDRGLSTAVVTFDRHPATVVRPDSAPQLLTDLDQKLELLASCRIDRTLVLPFDKDRADESAEEFVAEILVRSLGTRLVVVGEDFHFGHGRKGNVALLRELGETWGFAVDGVSLTDDREGAVSSTRIRELVTAGDVARAAELLGRPHQVRGPVVHGDHRGGADLGFPTANVDVPAEIALPADGVYAGLYTRPDGTTHPAAVSVGRRPTFYEDAPRPLLEAYLLDFDDNLYGELARVSFVARLRSEERYESVEALVAQMHRDVDDTRALVGDGRSGPPAASI
jgi:riboflavin kinase/FMN adenylyltransferase